MVEQQTTPVREFLTRRLAALTPREVAQRGIRASVVEGRYRGGLITDVLFIQELMRLGYSREEATHRLSAAQLDYDANLRLELLNAYRDAYRAERISAPALHDLLATLGVREELREALVSHELLRRKVEPPPPEETALRAIGSSTVIRRYREGLTDGPSFAEEMYSLGYEPAEVVRYRVLAELELDAALRLEQVAAYRDGFRAGRLTEAQFRAVLRSIGIDPMTAEIYLDHERLRIKVDAPPPEEAALRATGSGVVIRRYREGWTGLQQFEEEMYSLGYTDVEIERYAIVATLEFDYDYRQDALTYLREVFVKGQITADEFLSALETLGMLHERALLHLSREQLRRKAPAA